MKIALGVLAGLVLLGLAYNLLTRRGRIERRLAVDLAELDRAKKRKAIRQSEQAASEAHAREKMEHGKASTPGAWRRLGERLRK